MAHIDPNTVIPAQADPSKTPFIKDIPTETPSINFDDSAAGMWQVMRAVTNNINAIQDYESNALMALTVSYLTESQTWASYFINIMCGSGPNSDMTAIQNAMQQPLDNGQRAAAIQAATAQFNADNMLYNQSNTTFSGITNGINQNSSDTSQTISVVLDLYRSGPQAEVQNIVQIL